MSLHSVNNYDTVASDVFRLRSKVRFLIERQQVLTLLQPLVAGARILDLGCGPGHYAEDLIGMGAEEVVGVDCSPSMLTVAGQRLQHHIQSGKAELLLADCGTPQVFAGGCFDLAFGAWLVDNADTRQGLVRFFETAFRNLRPQGRFVSVNAPPTADPRKWVAEQDRVRPAPHGSGGLLYRVVEDLDGTGIRIRATGTSEFPDMTFEVCAWSQQAYEWAAREAGFRGPLTWHVMRVPDKFLHGKQTVGSGSDDEIRSYDLVPRYGIMTCVK